MKKPDWLGPGHSPRPGPCRAGSRGRRPRPPPGPQASGRLRVVVDPAHGRSAFAVRYAMCSSRPLLLVPVPRICRQRERRDASEDLQCPRLEEQGHLAPRTRPVHRLSVTAGSITVMYPKQGLNYLSHSCV